MKKRARKKARRAPRRARTAQGSATAASKSGADAAPAAAPHAFAEGAAPLHPEPLPPLDAPAEPSHGGTDAGSAAADAAELAAAGTDLHEDGQAAQVADLAGAQLTAGALVQLSEAALWIVVRASCTAKRVPMTPAAIACARLTKPERAELTALAPLALPWLNKHFQAAPEWTGAAVFAVSFAFVAREHVRAALATKPPPDPEPEQEQPTDGTGTEFVP